MIACGGVIAEREPDAALAEMDVVCKSVTFGDRVYRAGDIVANARERGARHIR